MQNLIYYPTFEATNEAWIKYSLLYIDNFNPIIPKEGDRYLSDVFRRIQSETDLINAHRPTYEEGNNATIRAIKEVEYILEHPYRFASVFNSANIVREWKAKERWDDEVFSGKYTYDWKMFCIENSLAEESDNGLKMSDRLAMLYMTILAKEIAYHRHASPITDLEEYDGYAIYSQTTKRKTEEQIDLAKGIIDLQIPELERVSIPRLIEFRNQNRGLLRQFNIQLDEFYRGITEAKTPENFVNDFQSIYSELQKNFLSIGVGLTTITLGAYILINKPEATHPEYLKQISKGTAFVLSSIFALNNYYKKTKSQRFCRRYLTNLKTI